MELIKSSRLEYIKEVDNLVDGKIVKNTYYFNNYKVSVFRVDKNKRFVAIYINDKNTGTDTQVVPPYAVSFDKKYNDKSEDELIEYYLENTRKQNKDITINVIQKTWDNEAPPIERDYGGSSNIYYLNNGSTIQINWTSTQLSGETNAHEFIGVTVSYPYNLFGEIISGPNQPIGGKRWSDNGKELEIPNDTPKLQNYTSFFPTTTTSSVPYGSKNFDLETGIPIDEDGFFGFAANPKQVKNHVISKRIVIQEPSDVVDSEPILILDDGTFKKSSEVEGSIIAAGASGGSASNILVEKVYPGGVTDLQIIKQVRDNWVISAEPYGELDICNPNNEFCRIIDYKSPLSDDPDPVPEDKIPSSDNPPTGTQSVNLSVVLPEDLDAIVRTDIGTIKIYIGEPFDPFVDAFVFADDGFDDSDLLQGELEREFNAQEEEIQYLGPDPTAKQDTYDSSGDKEPDGEVQFEDPSSGSISDIQKAFIRNATIATGVGPGGLCAKYTYNHANNYTRQIIGKDPSGKIVPAGGNANQEGYFKNLERLGYKRFPQGVVSKSKLSASLLSKNWDIGDVVVYWSNGNNKKDESATQYGHTQIYSAGFHGQKGSSKSYFWVSDEPNNFKCGFVYGRKKGPEYENWNYIIFKAPKPKSQQIA